MYSPDMYEPDLYGQDMYYPDFMDQIFRFQVYTWITQTYMHMKKRLLRYTNKLTQIQNHLNTLQTQCVSAIH